MSILIKGMSMPESCDKCIYAAWSNFYKIYVCNAVRKDEPVLFNRKQVKSTCIARSGRADNCPLAPVPPHGRLIDADAFEKDNQYFWNRDFINPKYEESLADLVNKAPTIIPAEEGKN